MYGGNDHTECAEKHAKLKAKVKEEACAGVIFLRYCHRRKLGKKPACVDGA